MKRLPVGPRTVEARGSGTYRAKLACSDGRTPHRMDAGSEAMSYAPSTSPTPSQQPRIARRLFSGANRRADDCPHYVGLNKQVVAAVSRCCSIGGMLRLR